MMHKILKIVYSLCLFLLIAITANAQSVDEVYQEGKQQFNESNYVLAQETFLTALKLAEKEKDISYIIKSQQEIAMCHYYMRDKPNAISWLHNTLHTIKQNQKQEFLGDTYYKMSIMYIETGIVDSAEYYSYKAIEIYEQEEQYEHLSQTYAALSDIYLNKTKDIVKSETTIKEAEYYANLTQRPENLAFVNMKWYFFYSLLKNDYQKALTYINKAEEYALQTGNTESIMYAYNFKAECLAKLGDTLAATYMHRWFLWKDSVFNMEKAANMAKYEKLYETEKKEIENKLLLQQNEQNRLLLVTVIILFLLSIVIALLFFNRNNLKKKQHELLMLQNLQSDKERIARDLHDNVGGQLSYIIYSLDGVNDESKEKRIEIIESVNESVKSVISSLRETIWAISDANISAQDFSDKLKVFTRNLFKHSNTKIEFTEKLKSEKELNALLGLNLYRICQEILNNAFKYASASIIKINIRCESDKLLVVISDNGVGFDISQNDKEHYGLQNIRKRAEEFNIILHLETEINKGTKYVLEVNK